MLFRTEKLKKSFGEKLFATNNVSVEFSQGVLTSIIGPNGAGKTTLINLLSGSLKADSGKIYFQDEDITGLHIAKRVEKGICRSFQITNIFPQLTSFQNIQIPLICHYGKSLDIFASLGKDAAIKEEALHILEDVGLSGRAYDKVAHLSHGEQRQLEIGITLATHPKIIFLDEPTQGMNKVEKGSVTELILRFSEEGRATFIIIEHDMDVVFAVSERIVVLHMGAVIADGRPDEIRNNETVRQIYLGEEV